MTQPSRDPVIEQAYELARQQRTRAGFDLMAARITELNAWIAAGQSAPAQKHRSWRSIIFTGIALSVLGVGVLLWLINRVDNGVGDVVFQAELQSFCEFHGPDMDCKAWAEQTDQDYHAAAKQCLNAYGVDSGNYSAAETESCLRSAGVAIWPER